MIGGTRETPTTAPSLVKHKRKNMVGVEVGETGETFDTIRQHAAVNKKALLLSRTADTQNR